MESFKFSFLGFKVEIEKPSIIAFCMPAIILVFFLILFLKWPVLGLAIGKNY